MLVLCAIVSHAQSPRKLDSLRTVLAQLPPEGRSYTGDTARVRVLCELVLEEDDFKQSELLLDQAGRIAKKRNWNEGIGWQKAYQGAILFRENLIYQSIDKLLEALSVAESVKNDEILCFCYRQLGSAYFVLEEYPLAIENYDRAKVFYQKKQDKSSKKSHALMVSNIGLCQNRISKYNLGIQSFLEAIRISESLKDSTGLGWYHSNLGSTYRETQKYSESLNEFNAAIRYFGGKSIENQAFTFSEMALSELGLGNKKRALALIIKAKQMVSSGKPYFNLYISKAAYQIFKANERYIEALKNKEQYDSLKNINDQILQKKSVEGLKASFDNKKQQIEIHNQSQQNSVLLMSMLMALILLAVILRSFLLLKRKNEQIDNQSKKIAIINTQLSTFNQELEDKVELRTSELQKAYNEIKEAMVKGQTYERQRVASELHDNLGGIISSIRYQMQAINSAQLTGKEQKIYENIYAMIGSAYHEVRNISHNMVPKALEESGIKIAILELIESLNDSQRIRFIVDFEEQITFNKEVEIEIYSVLMEVINNVLKHANAQNVTISFVKINNNTRISISDDGKGIDEKLLHNGKGFKNIEARVAKIKGTYQVFSNLIEGTTIEILV